MSSLEGIMDYKKLIIEELNSIKSEEFLRFIYRLIRSFRKEWNL